jgi:GNAT superfamily N-acetyltransferase
MEREGYSVYETEYGFATWKLIKEDTVYIRDIYVVPDERQNGRAREMADVICQRLKPQGVTKLMGTVDTRAHSATESIKVLLGYGMKISEGGVVLVFEKEIN